MTLGRRLREWRTRAERARIEGDLADALARSAPLVAVRLAERLVLLAAQAFGETHAEVGIARFALGAARLSAGDFAGAERDGEVALRLIRGDLDAPSRIDVLQLLASAAERSSDAVAIVARLRALASAIEASTAGPARDLGLADVDTRLGLTLARRGDTDDAWSHLSRALVLRRARLGARDLTVGEALYNLATHRMQASSVDEAIARFEEAVVIATDAGDTGRPLRESALQNLGVALQEQERYEDAEAAWERALASRQGRLGPHHASLRPILVRLAQLRDRSGSTLVAAALFQRAYDLARVELGESHEITSALKGWKRGPASD